MGSRRDDYGEIRAEFSMRSMEFCRNFATEKGFQIPTQRQFEQMSGTMQTVLDEILTLGMNVWPHGYADDELRQRERDDGDSGSARLLDETKTIGMKVWPKSFTTTRERALSRAHEIPGGSVRRHHATAPRMSDFLNFGRFRYTFQKRGGAGLMGAMVVAGAVAMATIAPQDVRDTAANQHFDIQDHGPIVRSPTLIG